MAVKNYRRQSRWFRRYRKKAILDYRRFVMIELAKQTGIDENIAFYYSQLNGWDRPRNGEVRILPPGTLTVNQFISLVGCTEWKGLSMEQAREIAQAAGLPTDCEPAILKARDPRLKTRLEMGEWMEGRLNGLHFIHGAAFLRGRGGYHTDQCGGEPAAIGPAPKNPIRLRRSGL